MDIIKEKRAIQYIKSFAPSTEPYYVCYSGGKDSDVIRILMELSGVKYELYNNHTTVDAPETVRYIRSIPNVIIDYPEKSMWDLIVEHKFPPTRLVRYCCADLKERGGKGRVKVTGVRWAESRNRSLNSDFVSVIGKSSTVQKLADDLSVDYSINSKGGLILNIDNDNSRRFVESCYRTTSTLVNTIVDWPDGDVWAFLKHYGCRSNPLYSCGFKRIGCIGCPLGGSSSMKREFNLYPRYRSLYVRAFDKMLLNRNNCGLSNDVGWIDGEHVMRWWVGDDPCQISIFDMVGDSYV